MKCWRQVVALCVSILVVAGLVCGCGRGRERVTVAGSTAFLPFAEVLVEKYLESHPEVAISVQGGGSMVGVRSAASGVAQIGMADLLELPEEAKVLQTVVVARDGVVMVVHPQNTISNITTDQIRDVYNGKVKNWKELGGADKPITVVSREAGSGTRLSFEKVVGGITLTREAIVQDSSGTIRETVTHDPNALGYLSHGLLNEKVKVLTVDGYNCTVPEISTGKYRLVRPVYLMTKGEPTGAVKGFMDYVLSAEGQNLIKEKGLLPAK